MMKYLIIATGFLCFLPVYVVAQSPRYARVMSANANLREMPSATSKSGQEVSEDTLVKVLDEKLPWYVVRVGNRVGWMHGNKLEFVVTQAPAPSVTSEQSTAPQDASPTPPLRPSESRQQPTPIQKSNSGGEVNRGYIRGPRGGCYYISGSGRKVYVDRSMCN